MQEIIVKNNDAGQRLDKFLIKKYKSLPFSMMYKLIRKKRITVNKKRAKENQILNEGDLILIFAPDDILNTTSKVFNTNTKKLIVAYEDENIIIVEKESGLLVHSDDDSEDETLIDRIINHLVSKGDYKPEEENSFTPALCNRIDRNTEGLVIAAKNAAALREMNEIIKERKLDKIYLAVVHGVISPKKGELNFQLEKDSKENMVRVKNRSTNSTKTAITRYNTISVTKDNQFSLLEIELITGRTHQIRASFAHIGHPLLGDGKYAINKIDRLMGYKSQALCAYSIEFNGCKNYKTLGYLDGKKTFAKKPTFLELFKY